METFDFLCEVKSKINYSTVITILKLVIHLKAKTKLLTSGNCPHDKMTCRVKKKVTDARFIHYYAHFRVNERLSLSVGVASLLYWLG